MEEFNDPNVQHKIQMIKENYKKLQNEDWHNLKLFVKDFVKKNDISYAEFIRLLKNLNNDVWINSHEIYTLKNENNCLNLNKPEHTANKLFKLISDFVYNYDNDEDYKIEFNKRLSNLPKDLVYSNKIKEIEKTFVDLGFDKFEFVSCIDNMLTIKVVIDIFKFNTLTYEYGKSKHQTILNKNKIVLKQFVSDKFQEMKIFKDVEVNIIEDLNCFYNIILPL